MTGNNGAGGGASDHSGRQLVSGRKIKFYPCSLDVLEIGAANPTVWLRPRPGILIPAATESRQSG